MHQTSGQCCLVTSGWNPNVLVSPNALTTPKALEESQGVNDCTEGQTEKDSGKVRRVKIELTVAPPWVIKTESTGIIGSFALALDVCPVTLGTQGEQSQMNQVSELCKARITGAASR